MIPFAPSLGVQPITIVAIATLVGGLGQLVIQWPPLRKEGFRYRPVLDFKDEGLQRVLLLMGPGTIGMAATQINVFVNTHARHRRGHRRGVVARFRVSADVPADRIVRRLDRDRGDAGDLAPGRASRTSRAFDRRWPTRSGLMLFLNLPATVGLIVLARPIVAVIFERGEFTPADTIATAAALQFYAIGLIGYSIVRIISPTFYALGRSRIPVMVSAGIGARQHRAERHAGALARLSRPGAGHLDHRDPQRRRCSCSCCAARFTASRARASPRRSRASIAASAVMGGVDLDRARADAQLRCRASSLPMQIVRLLVTIGDRRSRRWPAMAQLLRIPEFGEARDLVLGRFKRITG